LVEAMLGDLGHRGPDGAGVFVDGDLALGHRRLAILDLSERGGQPMSSRDGRWTIALNGEIFNYLELRDELSGGFGATFETGTDTEVLLEACAGWGVEKALERANGMFAFALWDSRERELTLARDRVGEKPLVYALTGPGGATLVFASELKALRRSSERRLDPAAVDAYLALGYIPAPLAIFRDCRKLAAGHLLRVRNGSVAIRRWWFPENARPKRAAAKVERAAELRELLGDAVRLRLRSDVPVALLLSGGVDSSVIAAECARLDARPRAFTVIFGGDDRDARYARLAARRFDLEHEMVEVSARSITGEIENILRHYDEPFADSSALPSFALARALRGRYKVALNGDGGDEAFGGYRHYQRIEWKQAAKAVAAAAGLVDGRGAGAVGRYVESKALFRAADRARLLNGNADIGTGGGAGGKVSLRALIGRDEFLAQAGGGGGALKRALWSDRHLYLANDLTYKMDIALGAHGIEGRGPFLDARVLEWAQELDAGELVRGGRQKILLRKAYRGLVPDQILDRPKLGFGAPIGRWLAGPLAEFARDVGECRLLERVPRKRLGRDRMAGDREWALVAFANWAREWRATW
jgi:asparagine synthase (glutamine-hydrolysing)